jgi:hypothetical protein
LLHAFELFFKIGFVDGLADVGVGYGGGDFFAKSVLFTKFVPVRERASVTDSNSC